MSHTKKRIDLAGRLSDGIETTHRASISVQPWRLRRDLHNAKLAMQDAMEQLSAYSGELAVHRARLNDASGTPDRQRAPKPA